MPAGNSVRRWFLGERAMLKNILAATAVLTLMSGAGFAQSSSSSTSTTVVTPPIAPTSHVDETTTVKRTVTKHGVDVDEDTEGDVVTTPGVPGSARTTTQTTTINR
jgi:hypothetical protein